MTLDGSLPQDRWDGLSHAQYVDRCMTRGLGWGALGALVVGLGLAACDASLLPAAVVLAAGGLIGRSYGERHGPDNH